MTSPGQARTERYERAPTATASRSICEDARVIAVSAVPPVVAAEVIHDLRWRLERFRTVTLPDPDGWAFGVSTNYLDNLLRSWHDDYDWRDAEARIRQLPWTVTGPPDAPVRFVHQATTDRSAPVVVLLHGWPDSVLRFARVLPLLTDLNVLVPALPGYPFSAPTTRRVASAADMASAIADAVFDLGYERYVLSAGDVGTDIAESWAATHPDRVVGLHLTDLSHHHALLDPPTDLSAEERVYLDAIHAWHDDEGGYNHLQSTKPNTLAVGLGDSPAGLAAWLVEKLHAWSDCGDDLDTVFSTPRRSRLGHCLLGHRHDRHIVRALRPPSHTRCRARSDGLHPVPERPGQRPPTIRTTILRRPILGNRTSRRPLRRLGTPERLRRWNTPRTHPPPLGPLSC